MQIMEKMEKMDVRPSEYERYIEPFLGSGALFFHMQPKSAVLNDLNSDLINFYDTVKKHYKRL